MLLTFDDIVFSIILVFPIALFYTLAKKHWIDKNLKTAFWQGIFSGVIAILLVRAVYTSIELYLGGELRSFLSSPREWYIILIACIGIVGFVEEGFKALAAHIVCCINKNDGFRPTFVFMSFAGSALSFSFLENINYYYAFGSSVVLPRVLVSSIAHLAFSCICSYFSAKAFKLQKALIKTSFFLNLGLLSASVLHGIFDYMLIRFPFFTISGFIIALLSFFLFLIYEIWIEALKNDLPLLGELSVCSNCRALTVERIRFCPFCGNRVKKIDSLPTVIKEINSNQ